MPLFLMQLRESTKVMRLSSATAIALVLLGVCVADTEAAPPSGWVLSGSSPEAYEVGTARSEGGESIAFLKATVDSPDGFGTLMQTISADGHRGQRIRLSGSLKSADVTDWGGLWMRVDGFDGMPLEFDNMGDRPITGNTDWQQYDIVLDIPGESVAISFGIMLVGGGEIWLDKLRFREVDKSVRLTGGMQEMPANPLDFDTEQ